MVALATAALRDAANSAEVVERLERAVGTKVCVLEGDEEARLCFIGQCAGVWTGPGPTLGMDLGGGSLEAAVGDGRDVVLATSAAVGPARLRGELGDRDPLSADDVALVHRRTCEAVAPMARQVARWPDVSGADRGERGDCPRARPPGDGTGPASAVGGTRRGEPGRAAGASGERAGRSTWPAWTCAPAWRCPGCRPGVPRCSRWARLMLATVAEPGWAFVVSDGAS